jgi:hypothetical protein
MSRPKTINIKLGGNDDVMVAVQPQPAEDESVVYNHLFVSILLYSHALIDDLWLSSSRRPRPRPSAFAPAPPRPVVPIVLVPLPERLLQDPAAIATAATCVMDDAMTEDEVEVQMQILYSKYTVFLTNLLSCRVIVFCRMMTSELSTTTS